MLRDALRRIPAITAALPLLLLVAACGPYPRPAFQPDFQRGSDALSVWLTDTPGADARPFTVFHLNRAAHVAIFDIRPGVGVQAIYPWDAAGSTQLVPAGLRSVTPFGFARGFRSPSHAAPAYASYAGRECLAAMRSPVVWRLIIASDRPLTLHRLVGDVAFAFRPGLHTRSFAFGTAFDVMDAIVARTVPGALPGGDLAGGGQWDVYWTAGWARGDCQRPLLPVPRIAAGDPPPGSDPSEGEGGEEGVGDAEIVDGFRVPVVTDRPAIAWNGAEEGDGDDTGGEASEARPTPAAPLIRGPETRGRDAPRVVDWRRHSGRALGGRGWSGDAGRGLQARPLRRGWGETGRGIRFRGGGVRPDRGAHRAHRPAPVRRAPAPRPTPRAVSRSGSDDDSGGENRPRRDDGGS